MFPHVPCLCAELKWSAAGPSNIVTFLTWDRDWSNHLNLNKKASQSDGKKKKKTMEEC